jgi:uncharacterized membrane protein YidH (DUF202 family)
MREPAEDIEDIYPGLAQERTELAWTRTAISFAALGGVLVKNNPYAGFPIMAVAVVIWRLGRLAGVPGPARDRSRRLLLITVVVTGVSIAALALTLLGPESAGFRP